MAVKATIIPLPTATAISLRNPHLYEALADLAQSAAPQPAPSNAKVGYARFDSNGKPVFTSA
jgi:hypothetical protein